MVKTKRLSLTLVFGVLACGAGVVHAEEDESTRIRVITYNVQFLPGIASISNQRKEPAYRASRIAEEMSRYDIVGLQETFEGRYRQQIIDELRIAWEGRLNVVESPRPEGFSANGGCLILTRLPIVDSGAVVFEHFSSPKKYGLRADGHAAKGVIHARIARGANALENTIDVFVTHLEARADELRPLQYAEAAAFLKTKVGANRPFLFLGDFNTKGMADQWEKSESPYNVLLKALNGVRGKEAVVDVWRALRGKAFGGTTEQESAEVGKRIDYIFLSNPPGGSARLKPTSIEVNLFRDPKVIALSDHNAVEGDFVWAGKQP